MRLLLCGGDIYKQSEGFEPSDCLFFSNDRLEEEEISNHPEGLLLAPTSNKSAFRDVNCPRLQAGRSKSPWN